MADLATEETSNEELELTDLAPDDDAQKGEEPQDKAPEPSEDDGDLQIEIEGEESEDEPHLVKQLRNELRETHRKLAEKERAATPRIELGPKPTLEGCDYDEEKFDAELSGWYERKRQADTAEQDAQRAQEQATQQFQKARAAYQASAARKGIRDIDEAEQAVSAALSPAHVGAIIQYSKEPDLIVAALHRHPARLNAIAAETDPMRQFRMIWELESKVKPTMRRAAPPPAERGSILKGSTANSHSVDKKLAALEEEADRTGNRTKLIAYRASMRASK